MQSNSWGHFISPIILTEVNKLWPQVFDTLEVNEDYSSNGVLFCFKRSSDGLYIAIAIPNEVFYDSSNPVDEIMTIIKGNFSEILKSGMKHALHAFTYGASQKTIKNYYEDDFGSSAKKYSHGPVINDVEVSWSLAAIDYYLELHFPDYHFMTGIIFNNVVKIKAHFGGKSWETKFTFKWLENAGVAIFIYHISKMLGLHYKEKPGEYQATYQAEYQNSFPITQQMVKDDLYNGIGVGAMATLWEQFYGHKQSSRAGQFYEQDGIWIPVGLTLADIT